MRVLYVTGSCLSKNTSANMSHNAYVQGLLDNGCEVDILMSKDSWGMHDSGLPVWDNARYYCYASNAYWNKIRTLTRKLIPYSEIENRKYAYLQNTQTKSTEMEKTTVNVSYKTKLRSYLKKIYYRCFPNDPLYPLEYVWLKNASHFQSNYEYDLVVSNSSPAASHKLVSILLQSNKISCKRWIQIWEDPWYADIYKEQELDILLEEKALLSTSNEIYYVSPLTLEYQKKLFPECCEKMKHIPLPYLDFSEENRNAITMNFGYFGDYYSHTRNLIPFYQALKNTGYTGSIYGDSDLRLESTNKIKVCGRVTLDVLTEIQAQTGILVHLCNLHGGQIPGKIYHYSATKKPILFILDGTKQEQSIIKSYFEQFNRYYFCENTVESISMTIEQICMDYTESIEYEPVKQFSPKVVVRRILSES